MHPDAHNEQPQRHPESDAENPVSPRSGPGSVADQKAIQRDSTAGVNPQNTSSMPRAEDDDETLANSPEYNDQPPKK